MNPIQRLRKIEREPTTRKIVRESISILVVSSIISSVGGLSLELVRAKLLLFLPLLIMLPAMNDMIGDFGSIISSKFTTALFAGHIKRKDWWKSPRLHSLFVAVLSVAVISSLFMAVVSYSLAFIKGFPFDVGLFFSVLGVSLLSTIILVAVIFAVSVIGGLYVHKKGHDPDNYLIPLATGIADLGSMVILAVVLLYLL